MCFGWEKSCNYNDIIEYEGKKYRLLDAYFKEDGGRREPKLYRGYDIQDIGTRKKVFRYFDHDDNPIDKEIRKRKIKSC